MADGRPYRRPHPRSLLVRAVLVVRSAWLVVGIGAALAAVVPSGWHTLLIVLGIYYAYTRVVQVFYDYVAIRYSGNSRGIRFVRGVIGSEEKQFRWKSVVSVAVNQTLLQRVAGVADVMITVKASEMASVTLPGVGIAEATRVVRLHAQSRGQSCGPVPPRREGSSPVVSASDAGRDVEPAGAVTPVLRAPDFLLIGVCTGAFVFFVPSLYSSAAELLPLFGLQADVLPSIREIARLDPVTLIMFIGAAAVGSLVYGTSVAWLRYRGFSVSRRLNGELVFEAGLAAKERRIVSADAVVAYELRRPLLMLPANRVFLRAVVRGEAGRVTRGMLLPLTRAADGLETLRTLTELQSVDITLHGDRASWRIVTPVLAGSGLLLTAVASVASVPLAIMVASAAFLLLRAADARLGRIGVATSLTGERWVIAQRGTVFRSLWAINAESIDVSRWSGVGRRHGAQTVTIRGRRTVRLTVWPTSARLALQLRRGIDSSAPLSLERNLR